MKFSESWLREWVDPAIDTEALIAQITMAGLEVDAFEVIAGKFSAVVVGEILSVQPHPNADKLTVCQVAGNSEDPVQVVCGAPNARPGIKVPFALVGAQLPGGMTIRKAKLRDVESHGMLCARDELGIGDNSAGLWELPADAPTGSDLRDYLNLDDVSIEVDLTPNRGDCLSIRGLAREVGVLNRLAVTGPVCEPIAPQISDTLPIHLGAGTKCPRYCGRVIRDIDISRPTPLWLVEKLRRSGVRSIDPVVDITNYVLLELGQPMHAFDLASLKTGIVVRDARAGETLTLLDDSSVELLEGTLLIADGETPVAMAGIMGGAATAVSDSTRDIFLESAFFHPLAIVGQGRKYGIHTDSSHRFERGVDPAMAVAAMERATHLILAIVGGQPGPVVCEQLTEQLPASVEIQFGLTRLKQQLALDIAAEQVEDILQRLGLECHAQDEGSWRVMIPSWRFDLEIEADLVEEIARIYGYNNLPLTTPVAPMAIATRNESLVPLSDIRACLVNRDYHEAVTYSFVDPSIQKQITPDAQAIPLANPISADLAEMRTSLWPGLIAALIRNQNRQHQRIRLFETGLRFLPGISVEAELIQERMVAGLVSGNRLPDGWSHSHEKVDFYDIKNDVEALVSLTGEPSAFDFQAASFPALHPGQCARIFRRGIETGVIGKLHPGIQRNLEIEQPVYLFELRLSVLETAAIPAFRDISRSPEVKDDIAVIIDKNIAVEKLLQAIRLAAGSYLIDLKVFDVYQGKGIENDRKSIGLNLTFQHHSRTLTESEIIQTVTATVTRLQEELGAELRGEFK